MNILGIETDLEYQAESLTHVLLGHRCLDSFETSDNDAWNMIHADYQLITRQS